MSTAEVVVTGLGVVSALGPDVAAFTAGLRRGETALGRPRQLALLEGRSEIVGEAPPPSLPSSYVLPSWSSRPDRFGLAASFEAVRHAGLSPASLRGAAVIFGTGVGGAQQTEEYLRTLIAGGQPDLGLLLPHQPCAVTDLVARALGATGPRSTVMTACSSSAIALSQGRDLILLGHADLVVCGGAEGLCNLTSAGFSALRATSKSLCCPFDRQRAGLNLGEGAAVLILESAAHAQKRGARILARFVGAGLSCDAHHMTAPQPQGIGALSAMRAACQDAQLAPARIGYLNAHGTGTPHNDAAETAAVHALLGAQSHTVPISSIKSLLGHTLGAAGAIEAAASVVSLCEGFLPPTAQLQEPDPAFGDHFDFITTKSRPTRVDYILSSSFAFGGNNAALLFGSA